MTGAIMKEDQERVSSLVESEQALKPQPSSPSAEQVAHPQQTPLEHDSAATKAERIERHGTTDSGEEPSSKRVKLEPSGELELRKEAPARSDRQKGVTPIKAESVAFQQIPGLQAHSVSDSLCMLLVVARAKVPRRQIPMLPKGPMVLSAPPMTEIPGGKESQKAKISTAILALQRTKLAYVKVALMRRNSLQPSVDLAIGVFSSMIYGNT